MSTILKAERLSKQYLRKTQSTARYFDAVQEASLELHDHEFVAIMGRSGSGKTTLLTMLAGLLMPDNGEVYLGSTNIYELSDAELSQLRTHKIAFIPQGYSALHSLSVLENIMLPASMAGCDESELANYEKRAHEILHALDIDQLAESYPKQLSGGELRRVAIARALAMSPSVILADEPSADLDDENTRAVLELLRSCANEGAAVCLVTHEHDALSYADRNLRMNAGALEA